jgi:hypothetical protein
MWQEMIVASFWLYLGIYLGSTEENYDSILKFLSIFEPGVFHLEDGILRSDIRSKFLIRL